MRNFLSNRSDFRVRMGAAREDKAARSNAQKPIREARKLAHAWERVLRGAAFASSYVVRKGLSRKAQLARTLAKHVAKRPGSALAAATFFDAVAGGVCCVCWETLVEAELERRLQSI